MKQFLFTLLLTFVTFMMNAAVITVTGDITTNTTWLRTNIYILSPGFHYVTGNRTLTIESGTLIKGDGGALVITRGSKLIASGKLNQPIVFTSNKPVGQRAAQDWGGIILLGKAPINDPAGERLAEGGIDPVKGLYGGTNPADNSGKLKYVRIEYAGIPFQPNNETNGLTMGGVGTGTDISYVQISYGGDDSFEWFGGTVNGKYLLAYNGVDDDFDTDFGYQGNVQYAAVVRDPNIADISGSNSFESDNDATGTNNAPNTDPKFSNVTSFGPIRTVGDVVNTNFKRGEHARRSTKIDVYNSVFAGWPTGLKVEGTITGANVGSGELNVENNIYAGCPILLDGSGLPEPTTGWLTAGGNTTLTNPTDVQYRDPYSTSNPNFLPQVGSPVLTGADFTELAGNTYISSVAYVGAFELGKYGAGDWTDCWCEFDPQNEDYTTGNFNYAVPQVVVSPAGNQPLGTTLTASPSAGYTIEWYKSTSYDAVATGSTFTPTSKGSYLARLVSPRGCSTKSALFKITGANLIDNEGQSNLVSSNVTVFPNPNTGSFDVNIDISEGINTTIVRLMDMTGRVISEQTLDVTEGINQVHFDVQNQKGMLILQVQADTQIANYKVIIK